jgi:two-component system, OmpR family, response regulator QseB
MRVLLIEDDQDLGDGVHKGLSQEGYTVDWLKDGESAEQALGLETFDIIVLDIGLPRRSGLDVLRTLRKKGIETPVMILSAHDKFDERVAGLDMGADDYLVKPFDFDELLARLRALQRRASGRAEPLLQYGPLTLNPAAHQVFLNEELLAISPREFALLQKLLENTGRVLSRDQLMQSLYGWEKEIDSNAVEVHIHNLRKKLGGKFIRTVRGVGYLVDKIS